MVCVVIDTNVLVSTLIDDGKPRRLVVELLDKHTVIMSRQMLAELADVLSRDKFSVTGSQVDQFVSSLVRMSKIVPDNALFKAVLEDPDDNKVLNTAYAGKAEFIVTGDHHLLALGQFKKTKIVNINQMQNILNEKQNPKQ
ncbi:MAG TPA: putative toxin-antitoxin system toxin component, PIN family [Cytophagales bacterium]|nr:putative toxin-antitoxin system toxin component, PIN family [Cytophagales bacterium]